MILPKTQDASSQYSLILNTAGSQTQVGLCLGDKVVACKASADPNDHTRDIITYTDTVLKTAGIGLQQLDLIGVVVGPGSYTGIRIGIATAQGLALPFKIKLLPLSLLEALGLQTTLNQGRTNDTILLSTYSAKNHMTYYQLFDQNLQPLASPSSVKSDQISAIASAYQAQYPNHSLIILPDHKDITLTTLAQLTYQHRHEGGQDLVPLYINQPQFQKC